MPKPLWAPWRLSYVEHADELDRCIFCDPEEDLLVHEGEDALLVMNKFPYASGHLLVAPKRHLGDFSALNDAEALEVHTLASRGIEALRAEYGPHGFNLGWNLGRVAGAGIEDHVHLHVVPRWNGDTSFIPVLADVKVLPEHLLESARRLRATSEPDPRKPVSRFTGEPPSRIGNSIGACGLRSRSEDVAGRSPHLPPAPYLPPPRTRRTGVPAPRRGVHALLESWRVEGALTRGCGQGANRLGP